MLVCLCWLNCAYGQQQILSDTRLNFSSPAPHIFSSIHGLLRQGYNTFFPNGFSVVLCEIAPYTPLYHGWLNSDPPKSPEWLSFTPYEPFPGWE